MRITAAFRQAYGHDPAGVWHAPGRVNLIGEHTDYNDGFVLSYALRLGVTAAVSPRDDDGLALRSSQAPDDSWIAYPTGVVWALREAGHPVKGANILVISDLPIGAGLSSSAAIGVVAATALNELYGLRLTGRELAEIARRAENEYVGVPSGIMDQATSVMAEDGHALFIDCRGLKAHVVPLDLGDFTLLIIDTGVRRALADGRYAQRCEECTAAARKLGVQALRDVTDLAKALDSLDDPVLRKRTRHVVCENHRVHAAVGLLRAGAVQELGALLNASHLSLKNEFQVSCTELDVAVEAALKGGARGARMTGAGFGGSAIALVPSARSDDVKSSVASAYADNGWATPRFIEAVPGSGARRLR